MSRKRGPDGKDLRTFEEWLADSRKEELELLEASTDSMLWYFEQLRTRIKEKGTEASLYEWAAPGLIDCAQFTKHLNQHHFLQEVNRRWKAENNG